MSEAPLVEQNYYGDQLMRSHLDLSHPDTLIEGEHYFCAERDGADNRQAIGDVRFVAYTACPAIVVVSNGSGKSVRILREYLFTRSDNSHGEVSQILSSHGLLGR